MEMKPLYKQTWAKWIFFVSYGYLVAEWLYSPIMPQGPGFSEIYKAGWFLGGLIFYPFMVMGGCITDYNFVAFMVFWLFINQKTRVR
jgi:hypothetical protein